MYVFNTIFFKFQLMHLWLSIVLKSGLFYRNTQLRSFWALIFKEHWPFHVLTIT